MKKNKKGAEGGGGGQETAKISFPPPLFYFSRVLSSLVCPLCKPTEEVISVSGRERAVSILNDFSWKLSNDIFLQ